jgi:hypothetical protein
MSDEIELATDRLLLIGLVPAWLVAGLLDWYWHRQTHIERTSGVPESITHLLMGLEAGVALSIVLFCEANPTSICTAAGAALVHELTAIVDVGYTAPRREVAPREQHTHSFLEVLPFVAVGLLAIRPQTKRAGLILRRRPPPLSTILAVYGAAALFGFAPHFEELIRCVRSTSSS